MNDNIKKEAEAIPLSDSVRPEAQTAADSAVKMTAVPAAGTALAVPVADPEIVKAKEAEVERGIAGLVSYLDKESQAEVLEAYRFAAAAHRKQLRLSGDPYVVHLLEVDKILAQYRLDKVTLMVGLMHDLIEEKTGVTLEQIKERFGEEIASLIDSVTKLTTMCSRQSHEVSRNDNLSHLGKEAAIENVRNIFLAVSRDLRVILVKFADRLHNLRTLEFCTPGVQKSIALETLDIFAPMASRLGIWEFKAEMENIAFRYAHPDEYKKLSGELDALRPKYEEAMNEIVAALRRRLGEQHIKNEIEYRFKHIFSIYRKLVRDRKTLEQVYDLAAIRVIVPTVEDCYMIFGVVHSMWSPMMDRIKDYIARPKPNNYRCLHTTVIGPHGLPLEVQIRTFEMHRVNEVGVAAHWAYKEGKASAGKGSGLFAEIHPWIRALLDWHGDSRDIGGHVKVNPLSSEVFVLTPNMDVIDLPAGSTPIDFAYRVHTEVGHRCVGALVNKKMVPLTYKLASGDIVEIQTSKNGTPSRDWLRVCASHQALCKIRAWFKRERRDENIVRGRESVRAELKRLRQEELLNNEELLLKAAGQLSFVSVDDLMASVGYGETSPQQAVSRLQSLLPKGEVLPPSFSADGSELVKRRKSSGREIIVEGFDTILTKMSHCCAPVPGDDIVGYITMGKGVSVHRRDCSGFAHLAKTHPERVIECHWNAEQAAAGSNSAYAVQVVVEATDRSGLVGDLLSGLGDIRIPVRSCQALTSGSFAKVTLTVEVSGRKQLEDALKRLRGVRSVSGASRLRNR